MAARSIYDSIILGPLELRPVHSAGMDTMSVELLSRDESLGQCYSSDGGNYVEVPLKVWEQAQKAAHG